MPNPEVTLYAVPTGGVITLSIEGAVSGMATLERAASGQAFTTIYSGSVVQTFIDTGDLMPTPLASGTPYQYRYTDAGGQTVTPFVIPANIMAPVNDPITPILLRIIQGALDSVTLPAGIKRAQVTQAMPLGGLISMPMVVINLDVLQQAEIPIGQSVPDLPAVLSAVSGVSASGYVQVGFAKRIYRVPVLSYNAEERDFYRDYLALIFEAIYLPVLQPLGLDMEHKWQASSGQVANDRTGKAPGFFFAEVLMDFTGSFNAVIYPSYPLVNTITVTTSGQQAGPPSSFEPPSSPPVTDEVQVPLT